MSAVTDVGPIPATRTRAGQPRPDRKPRGTLVFGIIAWLVGIIFILPIAWMVLTSFHSEAAAATNPPSLAAPLTLQGYREFFGASTGASPWPPLLNSLTASVLSTALVLVLAIPAAYALSIRPVRKWTDVMFFFLSTKMLPAVAGLLPLYLFAQRVHLLDNIWWLIILYTAMNLPIAVWMMRSFFLEAPGEPLEAAEMDGAPLRRTVTEVILPVVAPGLAATALICCIFAWNEFFFAVTLTATQAATVPVFLVGFISSEGLYFAQLAAAATVATLPVILAGWITQRQLVRGLSFGAIK
jgi:sorbitol/mannitol transport system permease protein